jgi:NADPH:quinone reductase-like Zn-dependent oxidoreductase
VNPSDVKNVEGQMERTVLPRVPGRDFSGASRPEVWGTGFTLDGSHAELIAIPGGCAVAQAEYGSTTPRRLGRRYLRVRSAWSR